MDGVKPYSVEWFAPVLSHSVVEYISRVRVSARPALYCRFRWNMVGYQYPAFMGHVAGKILDTVCSGRSRGRLYDLVLGRSHSVAVVLYQFALRNFGEHPIADTFMYLCVRPKHHNFLHKERSA